MNYFVPFRLSLVAIWMVAPFLSAAPIKLANAPALSPDGKTLVFSWRGDIWRSAVGGGAARRLTSHPGNDDEPHFSPDGKQIAFISDRAGGRQVFIMPAEGGPPRQTTFHSEGYGIEAWESDGETLIASGQRDHFWRGARRFFRVSLNMRRADELLFDAYGSDASLSRDGKQLLFVREGERWWRKGYQGSRSADIWKYDIPAKKFTRLLDMPTECRTPLWRPDGKAFYYIGGQSGSFNLWRYDLKSKKSTQLTEFEDDSVVFPAISRDGSTIVFRHLFDFYVYRSKGGNPPIVIELSDDGDAAIDDIQRRALDSAAEAAFTDDGLEIAFIAGGDLWVMDTVLREPRQVTDTPAFESSPVFSPDRKSLYFISTVNGRTDIYRAARADDDVYWWQNENFALARLTEDADAESALAISSDGKTLAYVRGRGELWLSDADGKNPRQLVSGFDPPAFEFSPDGKWIAYSHDDDEFNDDVYIIPSDGDGKPFNLSRHPDDDFSPHWSPDGRMIAFTGRRIEDEIDVYYVWLRAADFDATSRERKLDAAIEKIQMARKEGTATKPSATDSKAETTSDDGKVVIDFEGIHDRIRRVSIADSQETGLFWSPDSKKLAFSASVDGKKGTYTVEFPDNLSPKLLSTDTVGGPQWLKSNSIVGVISGAPASLSATGSKTAYSFKANQQISRSGRFAAAFDACWKAMRDWWYDERMGNRNWDEVRRKYEPAAAASSDIDAFSEVVSMMLGELNGSHLGFYGRRESAGGGDDWSISTAHLGVRFDDAFQGPGLKVKDVLTGGPAEKTNSRLYEGDVILLIDGMAVDPLFDLTQALNGRLDRDIRLRVKTAPGARLNEPAGKAERKTDSKSADEDAPKPEGEREVVIRPVSFAAARSLLYRRWVDGNREQVSKLSGDRLGYLHIQAMNLGSFVKFEEELYKVGHDKDGLVIDVRDNGGGYTTDHLLTALTQPRHAITVPRGGGPGYPHDRMVYASWSKPIIVLCNQNSFSNAEIFSHAVKTLGRGKLVGVPTAGGVISTGAVNIMDVGLLRRPFRGWFVLGNGEDMELNGAAPDIVIWPEPGDVPQGKDVQLNKAVELLNQDVAAWKKQPRAKPRYATERER